MNISTLQITAYINKQDILQIPPLQEIDVLSLCKLFLYLINLY